MAVHFVYRCPYQGPSEKFVARFEDETVLDWFRNRWTEMGDKGYASGELPGMSVYGLGSLGEKIAEQGLAAPETADELHELLQAHLYVEGEILFEEHCLQVLTDDDELQLAYFFFDDVWLAKAKNAELAAFLLHPDWRLPTAAGPGGFAPKEKTKKLGGAEGEGSVWIAIHAFYDGMSLDGGTVYRVDGLRLDGFPAWLASAKPKDAWPFEVRFLRSQLLQIPAGAPERERALLSLIEAEPQDLGRWAVYHDWLLEQGREPAHVVVMERALQAIAACELPEWQDSSAKPGVLRGSLVSARAEAAELIAEGHKRVPPEPVPPVLACSAHLAQLHVPWLDRKLGIHHAWFFFDDRWASAHPALARGVIRHVVRWDALS